MTMRVPMMPTRLSPRWLMASSTGSRPLISGKRRDRLELLDAEMAAHRGDGRGLGTGRPSDRPISRAKISACRSGRFSFRLRLIIAHIGVGDGELERDVRGVRAARSGRGDRSPWRPGRCRRSVRYAWRCDGTARSPEMRARVSAAHSARFQPSGLSLDAPQVASRASRNDTRRRCVSSHSTRRTQRKLSSRVSRPTWRSSG